jgi:aerobic C4-dicarboxylate transport protein
MNRTQDIMTASTIAAPSRPGFRRAWWKELWVQVMIAMAAGIALGALRPDLGAQMQPLGDAFIKAIRMLIAPIIFCTVVNGIAHMADMAKVGRVAIKALIYFEAITTLAMIVGLTAVNLWQPGAGMNVDVASINASIVEPYVKQTGAVGSCHSCSTSSRKPSSAPSLRATFSRSYFYR